MIEENDQKLWELVKGLSEKDGVTEIVINGPNALFAEKNNRFYHIKNDVLDHDIDFFVDQVAEFNNRQCDFDSPILDGVMPDGSRINIIHRPFANKSSAITIRKYLKHIKTFDSSPDIFGIDEKWLDFFKGIVQAKANVLISGGTGVGKTTLINLMLNEVSPTERIVTIEDTIELNINQPNIVRLESISASGSLSKLLSFRDLVKNALRMRPDRIIVGEVRGAELFDLLQALNTGHDGTLASIHANSPGECISRMESLYHFSGVDLPVKVIRGQISTAIDFIIQVGKTREGKRIIREISEPTGMEGDVILLNSIAKFNGDKLIKTGLVPSCWQRVAGNTTHVKIDFFN